MKDIQLFEMDLIHVKALGDAVVADDDSFAMVIESQLNGLDDSFQKLLASARSSCV